MAGKLTLLDEIKLRGKERSYRMEAKTEEESTPIKPNVPPFSVHSKSNPKPSKAHRTSLPDIPGSTDRIDTTFHEQKTASPKHHSSSSNIFENDNDPKLRIIKSGEIHEDGKYEYKNDDTLSIYTDSTYVSTTASLHSLNSRGKRKRKKKKKKRKKKAQIIQQGDHISVSRSNTPPHRAPPAQPVMHNANSQPARPRRDSIHSQSRHSQSAETPLHLNQRNLDEHNQIMLRKRNVSNGLSIFNAIGDGIPQNKTKNAPQPVSLHEIEAKFDIESVHSELNDKGDHVLSPTAVIWSTNIFAFLCSMDLMINMPTLYKACIDMDMQMKNNLFIWILVIYVIFQTVGALIISMFMNYERIKWILVILCTFLLFGNVLYTHGISPQDNESNVFLLFVGRTMCGIAGSILINGYSINTLCSNILNREFLIVMFRFITSIGMLIGPLIGLLASLNIWRGLNSKKVFGLWHISDTNSGSFLMSLLSIVYLLCFIGYLICIHLRKHKQDSDDLNSDGYNGDIANLHEQREENYCINNISKSKGASIKASTDAIIKRAENSDKYVKAVQLSDDNRRNHSLFCNIYVILLLFLYISCLVTFWSLLSVIIPIGVYNNDSDEDAQMVIYGIFALMGVFYIMSFAINRGLNHKLFNSTSFDKRVIVAIHIQCIGFFLLTTFGAYDPLSATSTSTASIPLTQLVFAMWFIVIGFGIATLQIPAIFCLITGTNLKKIGIRMSWFFIISSIGRLFGPIFGWYIVRTQDGSIDLLAHLSAFYLLIMSFIAMVVMMEANKNTAFFPKGYYEGVVDAKKHDVPTTNIALHSNRHKMMQNRVPSKSKSITQQTSQSRSRLAAHFADESNSKTDTGEVKKNEGDQQLIMNEEDTIGQLWDNDSQIKKKKHFNYAPVDLTESAESIKVTFQSKKTFIEKYQIETNDDDDDDDANNILQKIKRKSSRFLNKNSNSNGHNNNNDNKKENKASPNIQAPDVGLTDYQL